MQSLMQDFRYALRVLRRKPGFTLISILVLALGIGANTAIFSFMNALFLKPWSVPNPHQMIRVYEGTEGESDFGRTSHPNYLDIQKSAQALGDFAAHSETSFSFSVGQNPENLHGEVVSGNYFSVIGLKPFLGRLLSQEDDGVPGAHPVAVISYSLWKDRFYQDRRVVGKKVYANGHPFTIVGVLQEGYQGSFLTSQSDFYAPIAMYEQVRPVGIPLARRGWGWLQITGRLREGVDQEQAQTVFSGISKNLQRAYPRYNDRITYRVAPAGPLPEALRNAISRALNYFIILTSLVLIVVCANVAGSMLPHAIARRREQAIRTSLGASKSRVFRQWISESVLLSMFGGVTGIFAAIWCREGVKLLLPPHYQVFVPAGFLDVRLFVFVFLLSLVTGVISGLAPLAYFRKEEFALREQSSGTPRFDTLFGGFVAAQTCAAVVLLIAATLLLQSMVRYSKFDVGFDMKNLLTATINVRRNGYEEDRGREFFRQLMERLRSIPGVRNASFAVVTPLSEDRESLGFEIPGYRSPKGTSVVSLPNNIVGPDYFSTMGISIVRGRAFENHETIYKSRPVAIVNETMAKKFWPNDNAVGKRIRIADEGADFMEIVGVAKDITYYTIGEEPQPFVYLAFGSRYFETMTLQIRTEREPEQMLTTVLKEIANLDPALAPYGMQTLEGLRKIQLFPVRALTIVSNMLGLLSMILSALGIYGVISYSVNLRKSELGIRMALGATATTIVRYVLQQGVVFSLIGTVVGLIVSFGITRFLSSVLFQVSPLDGIAFLIVPAVLMLVAFFAALVPALNAVRIDPAKVIRYE